MAINQPLFDKSYGLSLFIDLAWLVSTITELILFCSGCFVFTFASQQLAQK